jgi:hypothetical protein
MKYTHLNNDQVHQVGTYIAATEAVLQGHRVEVVPEERRYRLRVNGKLVQVFTRRAGDWQPNGMQPVADDTEGVIFLDLAADEPEFYVAAGDWLRDDVAKHYGDYVAAHGGTRRDNPESRHHKVTTKRVAQWRDRWDVLGGG